MRVPATIPLGGLVGRVTAAAGGAAGRRSVLLLTAVLSLSGADSGSIGALAPQLERSFHIGNVQLGLLVTVSSMVGATASIPMGVLADRSNRVRLLAVGVFLWALAMVASGLAVSYAMLLGTRLALGMVTAVAGPVIPSLTGDLFPSDQRSRVYGYLLTGDIVGAGLGLLIAGNLGAAWGWRITFFALAAPSLLLAVALPRLLAEPARRACEPAGKDRPPDPLVEAVRRQVGESPDIEAHCSQVLTGDPNRMGIFRAARYILSVRTNVLIIVSSALGYFFFAGVRTFAMIFARGRFGVSQGLLSVLVLAIGAGGLAGTLAGGFLADRLVHRGVTTARLVVSGASFVAAAVVFVPGFFSTSIFVALPVFVVGAGLIGAPNPALDAARLDIVPGLLWGRAEGVRSFVKALLEAAAPLIFGVVSAQLGGAPPSAGGGVDARSTVSPPVATGIAHAFLIMLVPMAVAGGLLLVRRKSYLRDIATAGESDAALAERAGVTLEEQAA